MRRHGFVTVVAFSVFLLGWTFNFSAYGQNAEPPSNEASPPSSAQQDPTPALRRTRAGR